MADSRFFTVSAPISLARLAEIAEAEIRNGDPDRKFEDVSALSSAGPNQVSFLDNKKYTEQFSQSQAGVCIVHPEMTSHAPKDMALLITDTPYLGYARVAQEFYPASTGSDGISEQASVSSTSTIGSDAQIAPGAVIAEAVVIGDHCQIGANAVVGRGCVIGNNSFIGANVTLSHCIIGDRVTIFPGVCIGQDGFGFAISPTGAVKVPQLGRVIIENDIEIGANTTIDRGAGPDTVIGAGTMIDNLVQIGHNVQIGRSCVIVSQVGISGSTKIGDGVMIGGQAGFAGHIEIGSGTQVAAKAGVFRNVAAGSKVSGFPAKPMRQWLKEQVLIERLVKKGK
jgi:UDP-3-O-[3-hydroxymyristoyl] glucosamine N-acyltransferase